MSDAKLISNCPDRQKDGFLFEPYCEFGTDHGWVINEDGEPLKQFLHPCGWKCITCSCPRGFQR